MIARRTLRIQRPLFAFIRKVGTSLAVRLPQSNMLCVRNYIPPPTYIQETGGSLLFFEAGLPQIKRGVSRKPGAVLNQSREGVGRRSAQASYTALRCPTACKITL